MNVRVMKEDQMKAKAGKSFITNMKKPAFAVALLADAGIDQPPCFCCLHEVQKTCKHVVGELECADYVLYSESPEKVDAKFHQYIADCLKKKVGLQKKAA